MPATPYGSRLHRGGRAIERRVLRALIRASEHRITRRWGRRCLATRILAELARGLTRRTILRTGPQRHSHRVLTWYSLPPTPPRCRQRPKQ